MKRPPFTIERIDHVLLLVSGMDRAIAFYEGVLGCKVMHRVERFAMAELRAGASHLDLVDTAAPQGTWALSEGTGGRNVDHICFELGLTQEEAVRETLRSHGVAIVEERGDEDARGETLSLYVRDPAQNTIELMLRRPASSGVSTFIVTFEPAQNWKHRSHVWEQPLWREHAAFVNRLHADGLFYMGGPVADGSRTMVILEGAQEIIRDRVLQDPWIEGDVVRLASMEPWNVLMDPRTGYAWRAPD